MKKLNLCSLFLGILALLPFQAQAATYGVMALLLQYS